MKKMMSDDKKISQLLLPVNELDFVSVAIFFGYIICIVFVVLYLLETICFACGGRSPRTPPRAPSEPQVGGSEAASDPSFAQVQCEMRFNA